MKNFLILPGFLLLVLSMATAVSAIPYTDVYDAGHQYMHGILFNTIDTVNWTFDITDDGFNPDTQDVTSASIKLNLSDDGDFCDFWEIALLNVGTNHFFWEVNTGNATFQMSSLITLSDTGQIDASLSAIWGDFYFNSATLTAEGTLPDVGASPVPEPAAILLFGTGLIGLTFVTRRRLYFNK